tara:strand:+ start:139 stop:600 length:462 start_codon:yes stop_codon:yes gene_type:complete
MNYQKKIFLTFTVLFITSCSIGQFEKVDTNLKYYSFTYNDEIPSYLEKKINNINYAGDKVTIYDININSFDFKKYDIYSGSTLRALETEVKGLLNISIKKEDKTISKTLNSIKRFSSVELNPLAENQILEFIEREIIDDLIAQLIIEVNIIDL